MQGIHVPGNSASERHDLFGDGQFHVTLNSKVGNRDLQPSGITNGHKESPTFGPPTTHGKMQGFTPPTYGWLVVEPTRLKNISQNGFIFPNFRGENKKCLKPPPRWVKTPKNEGNVG